MSDVLYHKPYEFIVPGIDSVFTIMLPVYKFNEERFNKELNVLVDEMISEKDHIRKIKVQLSNAKFVNNAPAHIVDKEKEKLRYAEKSLEEIEMRIENLY